MYKNVLKHHRPLLIIVSLVFITVKTQAQITLTGQIRPRFESRNGVGNLTPTGAKNADFI